MDLEKLIHQNQGPETRNREQNLTGDQKNRAGSKRRARGARMAAARTPLRARVCPLAPCSLGAYKYPPGVPDWRCKF